MKQQLSLRTGALCFLVVVFPINYLSGQVCKLFSTTLILKIFRFAIVMKLLNAARTASERSLHVCVVFVICVTGRRQSRKKTQNIGTTEYRCTERDGKKNNKKATRRLEASLLYVLLYQLTSAVPVQALLRLSQPSIDISELTLNQRTLHVQHRQHHLRSRKREGKKNK